MILSSVVAAILRPWARRALQAENKRLRDDNDKAHRHIGELVNRLITANAAIANEQISADRQRRSAAQLLSSTKAAHLSRIDGLERTVIELQEQLDSNTVTADNERLTRELARERRLRDRHAANCPMAEAVADEDRAKERDR